MSFTTPQNMRADEHQCQAAENLPFRHRAAAREHRPDPLG
jgi:hypothetical protein